MSAPVFADNVLKSFSRIIKEIEKGSSEHDIRYRFVKYFVEEVLGYEPKYIKWKKKRADLTIMDENDFAIIKIETKKDTEDIDKPIHEEQAFKYEEETTKYIGLTNFLRLKIWEINKAERKLITDIDFSKIIGKSGKELSADDRMKILSLNSISKESVFEPSLYEKFDETYARIDITKEAGFKKLLERLNFIANNLLLGYTLKSFGEYKEGYGKYSIEMEKINSELKSKSNGDVKPSIVKYRQKIESEYKRYLSFAGFELWKYYSGKENLDESEIREMFCKETIYVLLNKLLFIRICEDKGLLPKNISNGGIERLRESIFDEDSRYKDVIEIAFKSASGLYAHFYETGILDWFRTGDGELNKLLNRVLWTLNQFNFAHVDRDILGNLYEKYLPSGERKKLGEFYTPTEVIDYILTSVGYTYNNDIETKDLLDPACGSGGFLVRATRRLISRYLVKFGKAEKKELKDPKNWKEIVSRLNPDEAKIIIESVKAHVFGLDINPFAVHIAEMNMLFQIIDLYQKVREKYRDYKIGKFSIHRTDSLEFPKQKHITDYTHSAFLEEQEEINEIKQKKFDFVVGNPPYVRVQMLDERTKEQYESNYQTAKGLYDLYVLFFESGLNWLKENGKLGFITSNKFMNRGYGKDLRKFILNNAKINLIIDFKDSGVFKDATNYPSIIILSKEINISNAKFPCIVVSKPKENLIQDLYLYNKNVTEKNDYYSFFYISNKSLSEDFWTLVPNEEKELINKIEAKNKHLIDFCDAIQVGVQTGNDKIYIISEETMKTYRIESSISKKFIRGRDVKRWKISWDNLFLIYSYKETENNETILIREDELKSRFPNAYDYLKENKTELNKRWGIRNWYELPTVRETKWFETLKIVTPDVSQTNNFSIDDKSFYFSKGSVYGIILKDKSIKNYHYMLGLLNSKLLEFFFKKISPMFSGGYYRYNTEYLEKLPIKLPETKEEKQKAEQIIKKVDEILSLAKKSVVLDFDDMLKGKETEKLYNIFSISSIKDGAKFESLKAEGNRIFINAEDFIEIKDKKTRDFILAYLQSISEKLKKTKDAKAIIYNLEVPKDEELIKEIAKKSGFDGLDAKEKIEQLENEINELVYELYGIAKEEKKIIEESIK